MMTMPSHWNSFSHGTVTVMGKESPAWVWLGAFLGCWQCGSPRLRIPECSRGPTLGDWDLVVMALP